MATQEAIEKQKLLDVEILAVLTDIFNVFRIMVCTLISERHRVENKESFRRLELIGIAYLRAANIINGSPLCGPSPVMLNFLPILRFMNIGVERISKFILHFESSQKIFNAEDYHLFGIIVKRVKSTNNEMYSRIRKAVLMTGYDEEYL